MHYYYYYMCKSIHMDLLKEVGDGKRCRSETCQATWLIATCGPLQRTPSHDARVPPFGPRAFSLCTQTKEFNILTSYVHFSLGIFFPNLPEQQKAAATVSIKDNLKGQRLDKHQVSN